MRRALRLLVPFFVSLLLFSPSTASAQKGCQDQACNWFGKCYGCSYSPGFACAAQQITCPQSCTETRCDGFSPTEACLSAGLDLFSIQLATLRTQQAPGTLLLIHPQQGPVTLAEVTFGATNLFSKGFALNLEGRRVETIRLGRARVYDDSKHDLFVTDSVAVQTVVDGRIGISEQPSLGAAWELSPKMKRVVFFVAEAKFEGGRVWKADIDRILSDLGTTAGARALER